MAMQNDKIWELPFGEPAELELRAEWGNLTFVPDPPRGEMPRLELSRGSAEHIAVHVEKVGNAVRVAIEPQRKFNWFGSWEAKATVYVPRDVHAAICRPTRAASPSGPGRLRAGHQGQRGQDRPAATCTA